METLKPCPCGKVPELLVIPEGTKWAQTYGNCCGEWTIEFRSQCKEGDELMALAIEAWNAAPRGEQP
jgi:hypothetical protein